MAHLPAQCAAGVSLKIRCLAKCWTKRVLAGSTGLEPATSGVTGRRSNQLNYDPARSGESESESSTSTFDFLIWWAVQGSNL